MLTEKAKYKLKVLIFWEKHGLEATMDAFPVKRSTGSSIRDQDPLEGFPPQIKGPLEKAGLDNIIKAASS